MKLDSANSAARTMLVTGQSFATRLLQCFAIAIVRSLSEPKTDLTENCLP